MDPEALKAGIAGDASISVRQLLAIIDAYEQFVADEASERSAVERCAFLRAELCKLLPDPVSGIGGA